MNVKIKVTDLIYLLDEKMPVGQVAKAIQATAAKAGLVMPSPEAGSGYLVWRLPGEGWTSFADIPDTDKPRQAEMIAGRIDTLRQLTGRPDIADKIAKVPDTKYLYIRDRDGEPEVAMVGWGYRHPETHGGDELETWINRVRRQDVTLGFVWDGTPIPSQPFTIRNIAHTTTADGMFHVGAIPVGSSYSIVHKPTERDFTLTVEAGRDRYLFDLTVSFKADITVTRDGAPAADTPVDISFDGRHHTVRTDSRGHAMLEMALASDGSGNPLGSQPECVASCGDQREAKSPVPHSCTVDFRLDLTTPPPEEKQPEQPEQPPLPEPEPPRYITLMFTDMVDTPLTDIPLVLTTRKKEKIHLRTDDKGQCVISADKLTPGERFKIDFLITADYCRAHGLVLDRNKRPK